VPVYDEQDTLPELLGRLTAVLDKLDGDAEVLFVDDGSADGTAALLVAAQSRDPRFKLIRLARNFGHQIAISAGLDFALGEAVVVIDADLQDPPELIPELVAKWREGNEIVYAVRSRREGEGWFKRTTASWFYRVIRRLAHVDMPLDAGDFRLVDRKALDAFRGMRERNRYVRGMFSWVGYRQAGVPYERAERFAGRPKYSVRRSTRLALDGIISFSDAPLRLALYCGFFFSLLAFVVGIGAVVAKLAGAFTVPGWASILVVVSFLGGIQLILMGMMGLYIGRIYDEVKSRPLYVVREAHGLRAESGVHSSIEQSAAFRR
jgi:dolichol-phosphate mannosyltransferase